MARRLLDTLGPLQKAIMSVVWELGEATVRQVFERLGKGRELAYTTILSSMHKLEKAGWLLAPKCPSHEGELTLIRLVSYCGQERHSLR